LIQLAWWAGSPKDASQRSAVVEPAGAKEEPEFEFGLRAARGRWSSARCGAAECSVRLLHAGHHSYQCERAARAACGQRPAGEL